MYECMYVCVRVFVSVCEIENTKDHKCGNKYACLCGCMSVWVSACERDLLLL